uniref:uDENN domain-containing protein n=1 Tax=Castor canadensis TaxID=51338 RepID=A0A8C0XEK3_CASCN
MGHAQLNYVGGTCSHREVLQTLTKFCFPFYVDSLTVSQVGQNFTFVLTDIDSKQRFGFCRLSSGAKSCFCILRLSFEKNILPLVPMAIQFGLRFFTTFNVTAAEEFPEKNHSRVPLDWIT